MGNLTLHFSGENPDDRFPFPFVSFQLANIECEDLLEGLTILHERLNAVAMPRIHQETVRSTAGADVEEVLKELQAEDRIVTISC